MRVRPLVLAALLLAGRDASAQAQRTDADSARRDMARRDMARRDMLFSVTFGVPGYRREPVPTAATVGLHWTGARPHHLGSDVAIGTMPYGLMVGALVGGLRVGAALPIPVAPRTLLLPSAGMSAVGAMGSGGGGGMVGGYAGMGLAVRDRSGTGIRVGATWHVFNDIRSLDESIWLLEVGFMNGPSRSRRRSSSRATGRDSAAREPLAPAPAVRVQLRPALEQLTARRRNDTLTFRHVEHLTGRLRETRGDTLVLEVSGVRHGDRDRTRLEPMPSGVRTIVVRRPGDEVRVLNRTPAMSTIVVTAVLVTPLLLLLLAQSGLQ